MNVRKLLELHMFVTGAASYVWNTASSVQGYLRPQPKVEIKMLPPVPLWKLAATTGPYVRIAALSGAVAVGLSVYSSQKQNSMSDDKYQVFTQLFGPASRFHFIHTLALLGLPLCRTPSLAATFLLSGIMLFSGTCYYHAFTGNDKFKALTPVGGVCFILGWLSMCI
ncbi:transmembrane protein 256 homolog isoform X2 [Calliopsis andreniformis]|uniref:transmembrane protein 256 homolog isoform X2 n=1 Tax=Calliopsis andreniformis TaxID=337506 RepID=UPI003FCEDAAF